jgi:hypothetical protein
MGFILNTLYILSNVWKTRSWFMPNVVENIPFELDQDTLIKTARVRPWDADDFIVLVEKAQQVGRPKAVYTEAYVEITGADSVRIGGAAFTSTMLRQNLADVERVFAFVATCGHEMDTVPLPENDFLQEFWWDTIKESLFHSAFDHLTAHLERTYQLGKIASMNPGSGDADVWPIEQQRPLFDLLGDVRGHIGVELTDSYLMRPNKTVSGIIFPTEKDFRTCQVCRREVCPSRSAPFDLAMWEAIHDKAKQNLNHGTHEIHG